MPFKPLPILTALTCLSLAACDSGSVPISDLATEIAVQQATETPVPSPTPRPTATPTPPSASIVDGESDCVTGAFLELDCSVLQRDVADVELLLEGDTLTVTVSIEGEAWGQFPDQYARFLFDTDHDEATGSRTLGLAHGIGPDTHLLWGWTATSLPYAGERFDVDGNLSETFGERDELFTLVDPQSLRLEVPIAEIGSDSFDFAFSLEAPPTVGVFDRAPEPGGALAFPPD